MVGIVAAGVFTHGEATVLFDEYHLYSQSLSKHKEALQNFKLFALSATPPDKAPLSKKTIFEYSIEQGLIDRVILPVSISRRQPSSKQTPPIRVMQELYRLPWQGKGIIYAESIEHAELLYGALKASSHHLPDLNIFCINSRHRDTGTGCGAIYRNPITCCYYCGRYA